MSPWGSGWHVDRLAFDRMLAEEACRAGAVPVFGAALAACDPTPDGWRLALCESGCDRAGVPGRVLSARILIDATGRAARCAALLGARRLPLDRLVGVAVRCTGADVKREGYVLVETTADGWWYSAPLPGGGMIAMLMTDGDLCRRLGLTSAATWWARLGAAPFTEARLSGARTATATAPRGVLRRQPTAPPS